MNYAAPCEDEVVRAADRPAASGGRPLLSQDGWLAQDDYFFAEQNARLVLNAEHYYRQMYRGGVSSWNLRDSHMAQTLQELVRHLESAGRRRRWSSGRTTRTSATRGTRRWAATASSTSASSCGSGSATTASRSASPPTTGPVTAASEWGGPAERKRVRRSLPASYEDLLHEGWTTTARPSGSRPTTVALPTNLLERAIGVIYRPETERTSHWFHADMGRQFDVVIHIDRTHALHPLERTPLWDMGEPPETYPPACDPGPIRRVAGCGGHVRSEHAQPATDGGIRGVSRPRSDGRTGRGYAATVCLAHGRLSTLH